MVCGGMRGDAIQCGVVFERGYGRGRRQGQRRGGENKKECGGNKKEEAGKSMRWRERESDR